MKRIHNRYFIVAQVKPDSEWRPLGNYIYYKRDVRRALRRLKLSLPDSSAKVYQERPSVLIYSTK